MALFSLSMKAWIIIAMWFLLAPTAQKYNVGPLYVSNFFSTQKLLLIIISDIHYAHPDNEMHLSI